MITGPMPVAQVTSGATSRALRHLAPEHLQQPIQQNRFRHVSQHLLQIAHRLQLPLKQRTKLQNGGRPLLRVQ